MLIKMALLISMKSFWFNARHGYSMQSINDICYATI